MYTYWHIPDILLILTYVYILYVCTHINTFYVYDVFPAEQFLKGHISLLVIKEWTKHCILRECVELGRTYLPNGLNKKDQRISPCRNTNSCDANLSIFGGTFSMICMAFVVVNCVKEFSARLPFSAQRPLLFLQGSLWETGVNLMLAVNPYRTEQPKADSTDALVPVPPVQISPSDLWRRGWRLSPRLRLQSWMNLLNQNPSANLAFCKFWFFKISPHDMPRLFPLVTSYGSPYPHLTRHMQKINTPCTLRAWQSVKIAANPSMFHRVWTF